MAAATWLRQVPLVISALLHTHFIQITLHVRSEARPPPQSTCQRDNFYGQDIDECSEVSKLSAHVIHHHKCRLSRHHCTITSNFHYCCGLCTSKAVFSDKSVIRHSRTSCETFAFLTIHSNCCQFCVKPLSHDNSIDPRSCRHREAENII